MNHPITPAGGQPANLPAETSATLDGLVNVRIPYAYDPMNALISIGKRAADLAERIDPPADDETGEIPAIGRPIRPEEIRDLNFRILTEAIRISCVKVRQAERISLLRGSLEHWLEKARDQAAQPIADMQARVKVALTLAAGAEEEFNDWSANFAAHPSGQAAFRKAAAASAVQAIKAKAFDDLVQIIHCSGLDLDEIAGQQALIRQDREGDRLADLAIQEARAAADQKGGNQ
jgi:hypothetical protein